MQRKLLSFQVPGHPFAAVSSRDGQWLFVSVTCGSPGQVSGVAVMLRKRDSEVVLHRVVPVQPQLPRSFRDVPDTAGIVMTHDGRMLVATHGPFVAFVDVQRATTDHADPVLGSLQTDERSWNVYASVTRDDRYVFISDEGTSGNITVIDLARGRTNGFTPETIIGRVPTGIAPVGSVLSPDGKLLYTTSAIAAREWGWPVRCKSERHEAAGGEADTPEGAIVIVDVETAKSDPPNSVVARVPAGCTPVRIDIMPDGSAVWTTVRGGDAVAAYSTEKLLTAPEQALIAVVPVGRAPIGIVITRDGKYVLNTNSSRFRADAECPQTITVIDTQRAMSGAQAVLASIEVGILPRQLSLSTDGETILVTNYLSDTVSLIDSKSLTDWQ